MDTLLYFFDWKTFLLLGAIFIPLEHLFGMHPERAFQTRLDAGSNLRHLQWRDHQDWLHAAHLCGHRSRTPYDTRLREGSRRRATLLDPGTQKCS